MAETTFLFPEGPNGPESEDSDAEDEIVFGVDEINKSDKHETSSSQESSAETSAMKKKEEEAKGNGDVEGVLTGLREKIDMLLKRRAILYQLMATSTIMMLHGVSFLPYFWNNALMNINTLTNQTITMWCVLLSFVLSCFYTPSVLYRIQMRWTMATGCLVAAIFSIGRFFPSVYVLIPCGLLLGFSLGPFYASAYRHIARLASTYEGYQGSEYEQSVSTFTNIFFACTSFSAVWLSILHIVLFNIVAEPIEDPKAFIGPAGDGGFYYTWYLNTPMGQRNGMAPEMRDTLSSQLISCLICTLGGIILSLTSMKDIPFPRASNELITRQRVSDEVKEVSHQVRDSNLLLMFPIYMCVGFLETFCYTIYVQAFIYYELGVDNIYFSTLFTSIASLITCIALAYITRRVTRQKIVIPAYIMALALIVLLVVLPDLPRNGWYYLFSMLLGIVTVTLSSQIHAMTSLEFCENLEVSHAVQCLGKSLAYFMTFLLIRYHGDNTTITGCVMATCIIALLCHIVLEIRLRLTDKDDVKVNNSGAYLLLSDAQWIPTMDPKTVKSGQTQQLMGRIPQVRKDRGSTE